MSRQRPGAEPQRARAPRLRVLAPPERLADAHLAHALQHRARHRVGVGVGGDGGFPERRLAHRQPPPAHHGFARGGPGHDIARRAKVVVQAPARLERRRRDDRGDARAVVARSEVPGAAAVPAAGVAGEVGNGQHLRRSERVRPRDGRRAVPAGQLVRARAARALDADAVGVRHGEQRAALVHALAEEERKHWAGGVARAHALGEGGKRGSGGSVPIVFSREASQRPQELIRHRLGLPRRRAVHVVGVVRGERRHAVRAAVGFLHGGARAAARRAPARRALHLLAPLAAPDLRADGHARGRRGGGRGRRCRGRGVAFVDSVVRSGAKEAARAGRPALGVPERADARAHVHRRVATAQHVALAQHRRQLARQPRAFRPARARPQQHARDARVRRQTCHRLAHLRDPPGARLDRAEALEQVPRRRHLPRRRRVEPRQRRRRVRQRGAPPPRRQVQRERREVGARDFGGRVRGERGVRGFGPQAVTRAGRDAPRAPAPLVGARHGNARDVQAGHALPGVEARRFAEPAVDHQAHAGDRQRGLGNGRADHDAPLAGGRRLERRGLVLARQSAVERQHALRRHAGFVSPHRRDGVVDFPRAGQEHQDVASVVRGVLIQRSRDRRAYRVRQVEPTAARRADVLRAHRERAALAGDDRRALRGFLASSRVFRERARPQHVRSRGSHLTECRGHHHQP